MLLRFHSMVTQPALLRLGYPGNIAPPDQDTDISRDSMITVDSGTQYTYYIPLKLFNYGGSLVSVILHGTSPAVNNYGNSQLEIESSASNFGILNRGSNRNDTGSRITDGELGTNAHITLIGRVRYEDVDQERSIHDPTNAQILKGVYGVKVVLLFHSIANPAMGGSQSCPGGPLNLSFVHPIPGCTGGYGLTSPGVHYCKCDQDGNFSFDFYINDPTWANYANAELLVTTSNDAANLLSNTGDEVSSYTITSSSSAPCNSWTTFREAYGKCIPCNMTNVIYQSGIDIRLNSPDGSILRNMEFAQEYDNLRPGVSAPQINTEIYPTGGAAGDFYAYHIDLFLSNGGQIGSAFPDHEYGHYCNSLLNGNLNESTQDEFDMTEGFAQFHSEVVRWYASGTYGDYIDQTGDFEQWTFASPYPGSWGSYTGADKAAIFLCNVYDKYDDLGFRSPDYNDSDNDDIGEPLGIFTVMAPSYSYSSISDFKTNLETLFSASENASIDDIYKFTISDRSTLMRPA